MIHFISDLHLSSQTPGVARRFLCYLAGEARSAEQLFILGDLFEAWPGDDCIDDPDTPFEREIVQALRALSESGVRLSVMHGNRDFMLGDDFAERCGATLLPDPSVLIVSSNAQRFVLSHGDALCVHDVDYQAFRAKVRNPAFRAAALARPLAERKATAAALRQQSEQAKQVKNAQGVYSTDLDAQATDAFLRDQAYATFIHGHTHQPATHTHCVDGQRVERWVLADWNETYGEYLCFDGARLQRHPIALSSTQDSSEH